MTDLARLDRDTARKPPGSTISPGLVLGVMFGLIVATACLYGCDVDHYTYGPNVIDTVYAPCPPCPHHPRCPR